MSTVGIIPKIIVDTHDNEPIMLAQLTGNSTGLATFKFIDEEAFIDSISSPDLITIT